MHHTRGPGELAGADAPPEDPAAANAGWEEWEALNVRGLPLMKPPYGTISAINLDRGDIVWQVPHGDTPDAVRITPRSRG